MTVIKLYKSNSNHQMSIKIFKEERKSILDEIETVNILCTHVAIVSHHHTMNYFCIKKSEAEEHRKKI